MTVHMSVLAAATATLLVAAPAFAQIGDDPFDRAGPRAQGLSAMAFLRFSFGEAEQRAQAPSVGLGFYRDCARTSFGFDTTSGSCDSTGLQGFELTSTPAFDGGLALSATGAYGRRNLFGWTPETGVFGFQADGTPKTQGGTNWIWIALGVAAGVGVAAALSEDSDPLMCTGNTVPDFINNTCVPLNLG